MKFCSLLLVCLVISLGVSSLRAEPPTEPRAQDKQVTKAVSILLTREHVSKHPLDDEISRRLFDRFFTKLDWRKHIFLQSDLDEFAKSRDSLDDQIKQGDISFAYAVVQRYLQRIDERAALVAELVKQTHDFKAEETYATDYEKLSYPRDEAEARDRWRKQVKYDLLMLKAEKVAWLDSLERINRRYQSYAKRIHQMDADDILELYLSSLANSFDPNSTYLAPKQLANAQIQANLNLDGIGAAMEMVDGRVLIRSLVAGGAAEKQGGLKAGDEVIAVGQDSMGEMVDVRDLTLNQIVEMIRGKSGTTVRVQVARNGNAEPIVIPIVRAKIELKDSRLRSGVLQMGKSRIGVISLPSFYQGAAQEARAAIKGFTEQKVDAVVLDLRNNSGGAIAEMISLSGLFLDGAVCQIRDSDGRANHLDDLTKGMDWSGPLVVVTSKWSGLAVELLAAAMQDHRRAVIVGDETTAGSGAVTSRLELGPQLLRIPNAPNLGALNVTMQHYYRASGEGFQKHGVKSDVVLASLAGATRDIGDPRLLPLEKIPAAPFTPENLVTPAVIAKLKAASVERCGKSAEFQQLTKRIERYTARQQKKEISLNMNTFFAAQQDQDGDKSFATSPKAGPNELVARDFYFNEVLAIAADLAHEAAKK